MLEDEIVQRIYFKKKIAKAKGIATKRIRTKAHKEKH